MSRIIHPSLWVCWPFRSTQNIGSGTTAYSLGGLGDFPGVLTNGPTWGSTGITFATTTTTRRNTYILVSNWKACDLRDNSSVSTISNLGEQNVSSNMDQYLLGSNLTANGGYASSNCREGVAIGDLTMYGPTNIGNVNYAASSAYTLTAGTYRMFTTQKENNLATNSNTLGNKSYQDTTLLGSGSNSAQGIYASTPNATTHIIIGNGRSNTSLAPIGVISFTLIINRWDISVAVIRNIYKQTLGQGLGLT